MYSTRDRVEPVVLTLCNRDVVDVFEDELLLFRIPQLDDVHTVTPKSVPIPNPKPGREAPRNHSWEFHLALVETNNVQTPGYKLCH